MLDDIDRAIINSLQDGFPVTEQPYAQAGAALGLEADALVGRLERLLAEGALSRFGPMYNAERMGGAFCLCAMAVSAERFEEVTGLVNAHADVAHNYERDHTLNMWFVLATERPEQIDEVVTQIKRETGLEVYAFPRSRSSYRLQGGGMTERIDAIDRAIIRATQAGLPLVPRPYHALADALGVSAETVMARLQRMLEDGIIRRIGAVPNHYALGLAHNAMTVWDVEDAALGDLGRRVGGLAFVTHCYHRPRHPPLWPYNLFAMVHGHSEGEVAAKIAAIAETLGEAARAHDVLVSKRILKKTGLRLAA